MDQRPIAKTYPGVDTEDRRGGGAHPVKTAVVAKAKDLQVAVQNSGCRRMT
jgi:hypothetical protein